MVRALQGLRVVELGTMVSGPYCGKLLADLGADVVKVEPPGGDPARAVGPFPPGREGPETSALFLYNNTNKRSLCLDFGVPEDVEIFRELVEWADLLVDNHHPSPLGDIGLDQAELERLNPGLVHTRITPYGLTGPRAEASGDELTLIQAGGLGNLLPSRMEDVDRAPVKLGGYQVAYHGGLVAALASIGALYGRRHGGGGGLLDVSLQEVVVALVSPILTGTRYHGTTWRRVPDRPPAMGRMKTRDGYVILNAFDDHHFVKFRGLMGEPDWIAGDEWKSMAYRANHLMTVASRLDDWMLDQEKDAVHHLAGSAGIPIGPINSAADVMKSAQFDARDYFVEVDHPEAGAYRYAGWPYRMGASPPRVDRAAPSLADHRDEVRSLLGGECSLPTWNGADASAEKADMSRPLEGVRVLELCWVWAGPYAGSLLAAQGAEVVKVEGHKRMDLTRRGVVWPLPDEKPSVVPPDQGLAFNQVNLGKKSFAVDLRQPEGVELVLRLAASADVVIDNMRPGALSKLGLGYDDLKAVRPDIIVGSSSGRGYVGRERDYLGYAMIHQGIGGGAYITGYPDDHPCHSGGDVDLMNAMALAYSVIAALHHRDATGEGQFIDYSQCEGVSSLLGEVLLGYEMTGVVPERQGNAHATRAPHNVYRAWGVDRWVALEVSDDEEFSRLAGVLGRPELVDDERFRTAEARKANEAQLDEILATWIRQRDRDRVVAEFLRAGVAAAPSRDARDLYADSHLAARNAFVTVDHPQLGPLDLVGAPWLVDGERPPTTVAPTLGQHTGEILSRVLGLDETEVAALREKDVVA